MPVVMTTSFESEPDRTDLGTQKLPIIPTVQQMETWNKETVLRWIQERAFLVSDVDFFHKTCGLSAGVGLELKSLMDEVKEGGKLSDQTVGGKRKGDEIDSSELSIPPKRIRQEDPLWESATRAREQRKLIRKLITDLNSTSDQHSESVHPLPGAVDKLSDPTFERKLAFPFIGTVPERFKMDNKAEQNWPYVGRIMFRKLVEELEMVRESPTYSAVWLYGTQGDDKFFKDYCKWTKHLSNFDVETQFIWITPSDRNFQMHQSISNRPAHGERYIPFEDVSAEIWQKWRMRHESS